VAQYAALARGAGDHLADILNSKDDERRIRRLLSWDGRLDAVPVPPLSVIAQGLRPATPIAVNTTDWYSRNIGSDDGKNPLAGLLRIPDLVYVVSVVLSLLAILFAFDAISGEKESGTLRMVLSNAVPRDQVLLSKWIGGYLAPILPFLIAALGGFGYAWRQGALDLKGETLQRLGLLLVVACLYISVFFTLSLFVSTMTHRAVTALFTCLLIWVVWILAIPNLAPVVAKIVAPAPSVEKINAEKKAVDEETRLRIGRLTLTTGEVSYGQRVKTETEKLRQEGERMKKRWDRFLEAAEVPRLQVAGVGFGAAAKGALNDILILVILNVAFFMLSFALFLRYDAR